MGQANSKQDAGAVSDENRLLYPIGGGHVGEGPVNVNPVAEGSQQQPPSAQEKARAASVRGRKCSSTCQQC